MVQNNINLLLFSEDNFLKNSLEEETNLNIVLFDENSRNNIDFYDIYVFDSKKEEEIAKFIQEIVTDNKLIINISQNKINGVMNLIKPFDINDLIFYIKNFTIYLNNNCFKYKNFVLNINKNTITCDKKSVQITEKEGKILKILFTQKEATKNELLQDVCGYDNYFESKAIETLIYGIKMKLKNNNFIDFIKYENEIYKVI